METLIDKLTKGSIAVGTAVGLAITTTDVYNIIGAIVLFAQLVLVITQISFKIADAIKSKDVNKLNDAVDDGIKKLDDLTDKEKDDNDKS